MIAIKKGEQGPDILNIKRQINLVGQFLSPVIALTEAPIFDQEMEKAIIQIQTFYGLAADGVVGPRTKSLLARLAFICRLMEPALALEITTGIPAVTTLVQAAHESNFGRGVLAKANNLFGVKWHGQGRFIEVDTWEQIAGRRRAMRAKFKVYDSIADCFQDRGRLLTNNVFAPALKYQAKPLRYLQALLTECKYPYATDPNYLRRCTVLANELRLEALVDGARRRFLEIPPGAKRAR
ncbi:MAG TPA: hypothetical protein GXZ96_04015 [Firmicutes bacterium]|nr:hypothetical protein [Bacillota bacterium]